MREFRAANEALSVFRKIPQDGVQKSGKPRVEVGLAERGDKAHTFFALRNDARLPQDAIVVRLGGFRDGKTRHGGEARKLAPIRQAVHNMEPYWIAQRVKNGVELQRRHLLKQIVPHGKKMAAPYREFNSLVAYKPLREGRAQQNCPARQRIAVPDAAL